MLLVVVGGGSIIIFFSPPHHHFFFLIIFFFWEEEREEKRGHESPRGDASGEIGGGKAAAMGRDLGDMMAEVGRDVPVDGGGDARARAEQWRGGRKQ